MHNCDHMFLWLTPPCGGTCKQCQPGHDCCRRFNPNKAAIKVSASATFSGSSESVCEICGMCLDNIIRPGQNTVKKALWHLKKRSLLRKSEIANVQCSRQQIADFQIVHYDKLGQAYYSLAHEPVEGETALSNGMRHRAL